MSKEYSFNDADMIQKMIYNGDVDRCIGRTISKLARYNYFEGHLDNDESYQQIVGYMREHCPTFSEVGYFKVIQDCIKSAPKYVWKQIDSIPVTQAEMDTICALNDIRLEKLAFVLLADVKYNNLCRGTEYTRSYISLRDLYTLARVTMPYKERCGFLYNLVKTDYIDVSLDPTHFWISIAYVNNQSEVVLNLTENNYKELAFTYLNYKYGGYRECKSCGRLFAIKKMKRYSDNTLYCKKCSQENATNNPREIVCEDCGDTFYDFTGHGKRMKCADCYSLYRRRIKAEYAKNRQQKKIHD